MGSKLQRKSKEEEEREQRGRKETTSTTRRALPNLFQHLLQPNTRRIGPQDLLLSLPSCIQEQLHHPECSCNTLASLFHAVNPSSLPLSFFPSPPFYLLLQIRLLVSLFVKCKLISLKFVINNQNVVLKKFYIKYKSIFITIKYIKSILFHVHLKVK